MTGDGEQRQWRMQWAVGGATGQGLIAENALLGQRDDRLEQATEVAVSEDVAQRAQLLGDGHGVLDLPETKGPVFNRPFISRQFDDDLMTLDESPQCSASEGFRPR